MAAHDDDRISYLAGEVVESLPADEKAALDSLRAELSSPLMWEDPPPALEERIVSAISLEADTKHRAEAEAETETAPGGAPQRRRRRPFALRPSARRPALALSLLAVAAIAAVIVVTNAGKRAPVQQFAMVVLGTPLAPDAHGSATLTKTGSGWRIQLSATGLPRRQGTSFYQAWLKNSAGLLVPVGTFNDARHVTLWSGVPVTKFRTLTVTQQVANGNPASSGRRVLTGTIH